MSAGVTRPAGALIRKPGNAPRAAGGWGAWGRLTRAGGPPDGVLGRIRSPTHRSQLSLGTEMSALGALRALSLPAHLGRHSRRTPAAPASPPSRVRVTRSPLPTSEAGLPAACPGPAPQPLPTGLTRPPPGLARPPPARPALPLHAPPTCRWVLLAACAPPRQGSLRTPPTPFLPCPSRTCFGGCHTCSSETLPRCPHPQSGASADPPGTSFGPLGPGTPCLRLWDRTRGWASCCAHGRA